MCGAAAAGRITASGEVIACADLLVRIAPEQKGQPVALVYTQAELTKGAADAIASASLPMSVTDPAITVDSGGIHLTATVGLAFLSVPARGDGIAGSEGGRPVFGLAKPHAGVT